MVERMANLKEQFSGARVLVVGDAMLDEYVIGAVSRISPEAPVPVLDVRSRYHSAGGAANVAMNLASLGATVYLVALVGDDPAGAALRALLRGHSIADDYLVVAADRGTISKTRIVAGQQQICRIDHEQRSAVPDEVCAKLVASAASAMERCHVAVLSDYAKGVLTPATCAAIIGQARSKQIVVDPKSNDFRKYAGCTLITPNLHEAATAAGMPIESEDDLRRAGAYLLGQLPGASVLITRGPDGMALFEAGHTEPVSIPTFARKVFDVVGAGDTVVATLAAALAAKIPIREAIRLANVAAGIVVEKPGTATVTTDEIEARDLS
jgi:D-beta-D-heptose 7-phosphate kinase/D-beta-D-heptose 1-phosphate adenosyltransferase